MERHCVGCRYAYTESWPKGKTALRCGYQGVKWQQWVTAIYPDGRPEVVSGRAVPAWCPLEARGRKGRE